MEIRGFSKFWIWFLFIINILSCLINAFYLLAGGISYLLNFALGLISVIALFLVLFKHKDIGLYIISGVYIFNAAYSVIVNGSTGITNAVAGIIGLGILWIPLLIVNRKKFTK